MAGVACPDPYFCSDKVYGLTDFNMKPFLKDTETVLVMFYNPNDSTSLCSSKQFSQAACETKRRNHAFAAVDCSKFGYLCSQQNANDTPAFTIFSNGYKVGAICDPKGFNSRAMKLFVDTCPVMTEESQTFKLPAHFEKLRLDIKQIIAEI